VAGLLRRISVHILPFHELLAGSRISPLSIPGRRFRDKPSAAVMTYPLSHLNPSLLRNLRWLLSMPPFTPFLCPLMIFPKGYINDSSVTVHEIFLDMFLALDIFINTAINLK
jgi:hypothetical protein